MENVSIEINHSVEAELSAFVAQSECEAKVVGGQLDEARAR